MTDNKESTEISLIETVEQSVSVMMNDKIVLKNNKTTIIDEDNNTLLHYAAGLDRAEIVERELMDGQKINAENYLGWTALMMAARNGHTKLVRSLIEYGADTTKRNKYGMNAFLISIASGKIDLVHILLENLLCGGISRQILQKILSPLSLSILFEKDEIFVYLIEQSFDINAVTPGTNITPLMFAAAMCNHKAYNQLLLKKADGNALNHNNETAQQIAKSRRGISQTTSRYPFAEMVAILQAPPPPPPASSPFLQVPSAAAAYPTGVVLDNNQRKSSNPPTPLIPCAPNARPATPFLIQGWPVPSSYYQHMPPPPSHHHQQMFFPPDFSPGIFHYVSPAMPAVMTPNIIVNTDDILNTAITPHAFYAQTYNNNNNFNSPLCFSPYV